MMDAGHIETEAILKDLEKRIAREYQQAAAEIESTLADYFKRFETKDKIWQKWVKDGTKTQKQYNDWRVGQMAMGQRWADQRDAIARELTNVSELAKAVVYDTMPLVYAENVNYGTYNIEHISRLDTNYTLLDRNSAATILSDKKLYHDPGEETTRRIAEGLEMRWNKQQIQSVMLQGLLQGESITKMSKRLASTVSTKDMNASIRNARTMTTGVQNAGRVDSYKRAQNMGIDTRKQWMATLDGRTRHSHRMLDGEIADVNKKFSNGCEFPGDPNGRPEEVYNCRCTLIAALKGFERNLSDTSLRYDARLGDMTYEEWKKAKPTYQSIRHQSKRGKEIQDAYIDQYKGLSNTTVKDKIKSEVFTPAKTIQEAEEYAKKFVDDTIFGALGISYKGIGLDVANDINKTIGSFYDTYLIDKFGGVFAPNKNTKLGKMIDGAHMAYSPVRHSFLLNKDTLKSNKVFNAHQIEENDIIKRYIDNPKAFDESKLSARAKAVLHNSVTSGRSVVPETAVDAINHELGHALEKKLSKLDNIKELQGNMAKYAPQISGYACESFSEYVAESFCSYKKGESVIDPALIKAFEALKRL